MRLSRRSFLGGILAVGGAALTVKPAALLTRSVPKIWGDCLHDDAPGINAALAGEDFEVAREGLVLRNGADILLRGGAFLVNDTITVRQPVTMIGNYIEVGPTFPIGEPVMLCWPCRFFISDLFIEGGDRARSGIRVLDH